MVINCTASETRGAQRTSTASMQMCWPTNKHSRHSPKCEAQQILVRSCISVPQSFPFACSWLPDSRASFVNFREQLVDDRSRFSDNAYMHDKTAERFDTIMESSHSTRHNIHRQKRSFNASPGALHSAQTGAAPKIKETIRLHRQKNAPASHPSATVPCQHPTQSIFKTKVPTPSAVHPTPRQHF